MSPFIKKSHIVKQDLNLLFKTFVGKILHTIIPMSCFIKKAHIGEQDLILLIKTCHMLFVTLFSIPYPNFVSFVGDNFKNHIHVS